MSNVMQTVLDAIMEKSRGGIDCFKATELQKAIGKKIKNPRDLMITWSELLRNGVIALANPDEACGECQAAAHYFVTDQGRMTLEHAGRDPVNPNGYMAYLDAEVRIDNVTRGYVEEALKTYSACCYKATAVMIGAAVENLVLGLRDELATQLTAMGQKPPSKIHDRQIKRVLDGIADIILADLQSEAKRTNNNDLRKLHEDADSKLYPIASEFRKIRNNAGHPASLDPINPADVHCNLLLFPAAAKLISRLKKWVTKFYV